MGRSHSTTIIGVACLLVGLVAGGIIGGIAGVALGIGLAHRQPAAQQGPAPATAAKRMTREEFRRAVLGKSQEEIIKTMGRPDWTTEGDDGSAGAIWHYNRRTVDPTSGQVDSTADIYFKGGLADSVAF